MDCLLCSVDSRKLVKEYGFWRVELFENQSYLGRCVVILKRHVEDAFDCSDEELAELNSVSRQLKSALTNAFQPDLYNYAFLGNVDRHVHMHFVPRYSRPKSVGEVKFTDDRFGKNYAPAREFVPPSRVFQAVKEEILNGLYVKPGK